MKKILLFSRDPGSANCIMPIYKRFSGNTLYDVHLFGKDFSLVKYKKERLHYTDINKKILRINAKSIENFLTRENYDLIVTGTAGDDFTERDLWKVARRMHVPTLAILDQWINYEIRFLGRSLSRGESNKEYILPDKICVMDEYAKKEMLHKGFPADSIIVTGNPYLDTIAETQKKITDKEKNQVLKTLKIQEGSYIITFVSEPIVEIYGDCSYVGYTQLTIFEEVIRALITIATADSGNKFELIIKLHPRNRKNIFNKCIKRYMLPTNLRVTREQDISPRVLISISNVVLGMSSMFLIETAIMGRPYLSVQIGLNRKEDPFMLSRIKITKTIFSPKSLRKILHSLAKGEKMRHSKFVISKHGTDNILNLIDRILHDQTSYKRRKAGKK